MWIKRINIEQFGNLKNYEQSFDRYLNIIAAPNETGKSTLIDFIFAALYGMERYEIQCVIAGMPWGEDTMGGY